MSRSVIIRPCRDPEVFEDWYRVEWEQHPNNGWEEAENGQRYLCDSARLDPRACFEGPGHEMVAICKPIQAGKEQKFSRCAVTFDRPGLAGFWRPRGSTVPVYVPIPEARAAADRFLDSLCNT